jgi:hypothetical protein
MYVILKMNFYEKEKYRFNMAGLQFFHELTGGTQDATDSSLTLPILKNCLTYIYRNN